MSTKSGKNSQKISRTRTKSTKSNTSSKKAGANKSDVAESDSSSKRFVNDLLVRGEAAKPNAEGKLPLEATHAITKENEDGTVEIKRARYKYY